MKGVVILGDQECCVKDFPDPEPGAGEVRVKMMASGICGSARWGRLWQRPGVSMRCGIGIRI